jgi:peptidoglycan/LPS O-acetylase OafA/YrhL
MLLQTRRGFGNIADRFLGANVWFPIAQISYGLYLLHCIVTDTFYRLIPPASEITLGRLTLNAFIILAITTVLAIIMNVVVETPMRKFGYRIAKGNS